MEDRLHTLEQIETERSDLITKLSKIDEKRATVSFEVYEKVKREYEKKLKAIEEKIASNIELVKVEVGRLKNEDKQLTEQEKEIELLIEEAELRYSIGEYNDDEFNEVNDEYKTNQQGITERLKKIRERLKWFESLVTVTDFEEGVKTETPEGAKEPGIEMVEIKEMKEKEEIMPAVKKAEDSDLKIDEHILELPVTEQEKKLDDLLVEEEAVKAPAKQEAPKPGESAKIKKGEKGVPCPKCSYMNSPDSWYCEKCGAEILESTGT